jgi:hypothetical protein
VDAVRETDLTYTGQRVLDENKLIVLQVQVLVYREGEDTILAEGTNMLVAIQEDQTSKWTNPCNN